MTIFERALQLQEEMVQHRRYLHQHAECGYDLPNTVRFVQEQLEAAGCKADRLGGGVVTVIGEPDAGPTILLRADMDALPMYEESGLAFASQTACSHCCGHDLHTTMMLAAAKILKEREQSLKGAVKLMFQPDEESNTGAKSMIRAGVLENPTVDAAMALHVNAKEPLGQIDYGSGPTFASNDCFDISMIGKSGHGARPYEAVDPIRAAAALCGRLDGLTTLHKPLHDTAIFTVTAFHGGSNYNVIPNRAELKASLRTYAESTRTTALEQMKKTCHEIEFWYGITCKVKEVASVPGIYCNEAFTNAMLAAVEKGLPEAMLGKSNTVKVGSEDFAFVTQKVPNSTYLFLGAGKNQKTGYEIGQHSSRVVFNEDAMPYGVCVLVSCALHFLNSN